MSIGFKDYDGRFNIKGKYDVINASNNVSKTFNDLNSAVEYKNNLEKDPAYKKQKEHYIKIMPRG